MVACGVHGQPHHHTGNDPIAALAVLHHRLLMGIAAVIAITPARANLLQERSQRFQPVESAGGMVAAQEAQAAQVGAQILRQGGNAVDAAVATSFAMAVTLPQAGNLGGGGFLVLWLPRRGPINTCRAVARAVSPPQAIAIGRGEAIALNFRETAPLRICFSIPMAV